MCNESARNETAPHATTDPLATRHTLLVRMSDSGDRAAWDQFVEIYAPLVFRFARRRGLQESDAADLVQEVLLRVSEAFRQGKFAADRGSFRGWLLTIARNEVNDWLAGRARQPMSRGGTESQLSLANVAENGRDGDSFRDEADQWDREHELRLFAWAADQVEREVQPATWQAFWQTAVESRSGQEVAIATGLSVAAVYLAKSRVMQRIRVLVQEVS